MTVIARSKATKSATRTSADPSVLCGGQSKRFAQIASPRLPAADHVRHGILAVDIGNTSTTFGYFKASKLLRIDRILTSDTNKKAATFLKNKFPLKNIEVVVIASVVPKATAALERIISGKLKIKVCVIGRDIQVPIKNKYRDPKQVGIDRLVNAFAFFQKYKKAGVIVDFGTAITFDVVSEKGEYLGGVIAPGIEISIDALNKKTALLPRIQLKHPKNVVGKDTVESIQIGCSYGIGGLCDRVIEEINSKLKNTHLVIATGGYAEFIRSYSKKIRSIETDLTLRGIGYLSVFLNSASSQNLLK